MTLLLLLAQLQFLPLLLQMQTAGVYMTLLKQHLAGWMNVIHYLKYCFFIKPSCITASFSRYKCDETVARLSFVFTVTTGHKKAELTDISSKKGHCIASVGNIYINVYFTDLFDSFSLILLHFLYQYYI